MQYVCKTNELGCLNEYRESPDNLALSSIDEEAPYPQDMGEKKTVLGESPVMFSSSEDPPPL